MSIKLKSKKQRLLVYSVLSLILLSLSLFVWIKLTLAATATWTNGGGDGLWSTCANWSGGTGTGGCPGTGDIATFNSTSTANSAIDATASVAGISIASTYSGIITQNTGITLTIGSSNYSQAGGTFTGGNSTIDLNGAYSLTGGTFTSTSGTMTISGSFTVSGSPVFTHNSGTVTFDGGGTRTLACNNVTFNVVNISGTSQGDYNLTINSDCNLPLSASPTISVTQNAGQIILNGTLSGTGTLTSTNGGLTLNSGASLSGFSGLVLGTSGYGRLTVAGATLNLGAYTTVDINSTFTLSSGTFTAPSGTMTVAQSFTITGGTFNANGGTLTFDGTDVSNQTISCNNATFNSVTINKTWNQNSRILTISSDCNLPLGASPTITLSNGSSNIDLVGTLSGTGTLTTTFGNSGSTLSINGGILSGFSGLVTSRGFTLSSGTVNLGSYTTVDINEAFTLSSGTFTAPSGTMTVAGSFTVSGGTFNANSGTITLDSSTNMSLSCGSATLNALTINKGSSGVTNTLTSSCTVGNFTLTQGTMSNPASAYTLSVTGNFAQNANTAFGGANLTLALTGTGNQTYTRSTGTFVSAFTVNKTGGTATLASSLNTGTTSTGQACNITSGTLSLAGNNLVCSALTVANGGNLQWRGSETVTTPTLDSGSTVTYTGDGDSLADTYTITSLASTYSNLTINSTDGATDTFQLGADLTAGKNLTISAGTFNPSAIPYNLTIGGNFTNNGTITARSNTVTFNDNTQNSVITGSGSPAITFYNLTVATASKILKFGAGKTFRINGLLTITGTAKNQINLSSSTPMTQWTINLQGTSAITYAFVQDSACDGTSTTITLDSTSRNGGNNGACWSGYPATQQIRLKGGERIKGNMRVQ